MANILVTGGAGFMGSHLARTLLDMGHVVVLDDLSGGLSTIYERVREIKSKGQWIELEELITYTEIGSAESRPPVAYPERLPLLNF